MGHRSFAVPADLQQGFADAWTRTYAATVSALMPTAFEERWPHERLAREARSVADHAVFEFAQAFGIRMTGKPE